MIPTDYTIFKKYFTLINIHYMLSIKETANSFLMTPTVRINIAYQLCETDGTRTRNFRRDRAVL